MLLNSSSILSSCQDHILFLPFPIGVLDHLFNLFILSSFLLFSTGVLPAFFRSHSLLIPFQPEWLHVLPCRWSSSFMSFNLQGSRNVPCSSFLTECFQLCSSSLFSFFQFVQPRKVLWFHVFVKEATLFYLFLFRFSPVPS